MLSTDGKWKLNPRLHSVKFIFDTPTPANAQTPDEIIFENPFPNDVPGVPKRFVFRNPTTKDPKEEEVIPQTAQNHENESLSSGLLTVEPLLDTKRPVTDVKTTAHQFSHIKGPVCELGRDIKSAVCAAWALILSSQTDSEDIRYSVCVQNPKNLQISQPPSPLQLSINRNQQASAFLEYVAGKPAISGVVDTESTLMTPATDEASFQTIVAFSTTALGVHQLSDVSGRTIRIECSINDQELELSATFDQQHFSRPAARLLLSDLEHILWQLDHLSTTHQMTLGEIQTISPASQRHLVHLNRPLPREEYILVHDVIAQQAGTQQQAQAVCAWDGNLSYSQLQTHVEKLSNHLSSIGVGPEVLVPVIFEKSVWSIVAILGVASAGGAVVALDPSLPAARIQMIVQDVKATVVLSSTGSQNKIPEQIPRESRVIVNESLFKKLSTRRSSWSTQSSATSDNALYVVYTSGSTGKPKGVVVTHTAFCSSSKGFSKAIDLNAPSARVLQYSSFSFDISMLEIFSTLMAGACLCIPSEEERMNDLASCISSMDVNWAMLTPSVASLMSPEDVPSLEVLCFVGEALPQAVADTWADHVKAINAYGPAECSAITIVSKPRIKGVKSISLGQPANCAVWIVTDNGQLASFNTIGEIVIEGPPVARGYLGDKEKTDTVFLDNPDFLHGIVADPMRCYRTGDLGRMSVDGSIDFFGRKDSQVKINGQRVELGEIEHQLKKFLRLTQSFEPPEPIWDVAVELLRPMGASNGVLTAFIASKSTIGSLAHFRKQTIASETDLVWRDTHGRFQVASRELLRILPAYMVPNAVIPCHALPLSASGKVDRKALRSFGNDMTAKQLLQLPEQQNDGFSIASTYKSEPQSAECTDCDEESSVGQHTISSDAHPLCDTSVSWSGSSGASLTPIETSLRKAWAKVLEVSEDTIRIDDDFFRLGGDSIGAIKVVAACRQLSLQINVANIFKNTVLRKMALVCKSTADNCVKATTQFAPFQLLDQSAISELREEASFQCNVKSEDIEDLYPCTHMQEGLMAVNLTRPGSYTGRWIHPLPKDIDLARFRSAWEDIHATSSILRTRFATTSAAGSLQAVIRERVQWLSHDDLEAYLEQDDSDPMYPGDSLNRFALVSSKGGDMIFVWTIHHMLYDGWSLAMLCNKLNDTYQGRVMKPTTDYRHFIFYTQQLSPSTYTDYWMKELHKCPVSCFPAAPKQGYQSFARAVVRDELTIDLDPSSGITMSSLVRAAWSLMISNFSMSDDVVFGATVSGRNAPIDDIESIEGPTIATIPIRVRLERELAILNFLRQIQDQATSMIPFEQAGIRQIKTLNEDTKRGCEFQNLLVVQAGGTWDETGSGPLTKPIYREEYTTFPVTCEVWLHPRKVEFATHVDEEVTSRVFVAQAIETVKIIMTQLAWAASRPYSCSKVADLAFDKLPSLPETVNLNQAASNVSYTLHGIINNKSQVQPKRDAVASTTDCVSYASLESMSSALARHLIHSGVSSGEMIPLCFEKSVWIVVAMLGVLKAGAAFVPLDPNQPISRLREVAFQVKAKTVLMSRFHAKATDLGITTSIIVDRESLERFASFGSTKRLASYSEPDSPAYVVFTSGSTGTPKGIVISHSAFVSSAVAHGSAFRMSCDNRVLQFSAYSFDASLFEILTTLIHGGTVFIPTEKERFQGIGDFIRKNDVNFALLTPSVARIIDPTEVPSLQTLVLGGEAPDHLLVKKWLDAGTELFNAYGPSECSVIAACHSYSHEGDPRTIGHPIGCSSWIVDPDDEATLVPDGEIGELLIGGPILADGYLDDPGRTAAAFIGTPSWPMESHPRVDKRLYKTGDLVKKKNDGNMVYVGRKDMQVKINGQRIELGDIESNLAVCLWVKRGVVLFPSCGPFSRQLVAVLELEMSHKTADGLPRMSTFFNKKVDSIRRELAGKIPSVMLPSHWVDVNALCRSGFPLSASGKVDRKQIITSLEAHSKRGSSIVEEPARASEESSVILPDEITAYELAGKIASLIPFKSSSGSTLLRGFDDLLLHASGLDSLNMMSLMHFIRMKYRTGISMQILMDEKTSIRTLAALIIGSSPRQNEISEFPFQASGGGVDIMGQINRYDDELLQLSRKYHGTAIRKPVKKDNDIKVFLTGASGYLGTQILRQLLERRDVSCVTTLVRSRNLQAARNRVIEAARKTLWWTEFHEDKLEVWVGDLSQPKLGLEHDQWDLLSDGYSFDVIIHNGAVVHWNKSYSALESVNVGATAQLLGLTIQHPSLRFTYVSGGRQWKNGCEKDEEVAHELANSMGYSQTKFVAEVLVKRAAERCPPTGRNIAVFRPGLIIGTPTEGVANLDDYIWRLTAANIEIGAYNADDDDAWLHVSDAATTAAAAIHTAFNTMSHATAVKNQEDGMTWGAFWRLIQASGFNIRPIPASEWVPAIRKDVSARQEAHPLWPLAHLLDGSMGWDFHSGHPRDCPVQLKVAVRRNLEYLTKVAFLPAAGLALEPDTRRGIIFRRSSFK
ncbi:amino acid adenylation domain-containing protein [Colletotrichum incanum]|uniref:Amino acid adenylation domain-containing protein n=1 Tax=Colletotrichum incanum TaxID=1573173 RepID=A0A161WDV9_COLIC|nr:amino acid adenylation domain-containing protein [Colletotrichum incanum]OHW89827.1 amino acid adenylation domain-containing protein [Colletotrichum incanum]